MFRSHSSNLVSAIVALSVVATFTIFKTQSDATIADQSERHFESSFRNFYGTGSDAYFGLGPDGLVGRWATENEMANLECNSYEACQFVVLSTVETCPGSVSLWYQVLNGSDEVLDEKESTSGPLSAGGFSTVEIGFNSDQDLYLLPSSAVCNESLPDV